MSLGNTIRVGAKWSLFERINGQVLQFVFGIALARLLLPTDFGVVVTIQIFTGLAFMISGGGMGQSLIQAKEVSEKDFQVVFTLQLLIGVAIYLLFFSIAPWFAVWFDNLLYRDLLRVSAISFLIRPFANIMTSRLRRDMRFQALSIIGVIILLSTGAASIGLAWLREGPWSLILGGLAGGVLNILLLFAVTRWRPGFALDMQIAKRLGAYGVKVTGNDILDYFRVQGSNLIVGRMLGPASLGLYNKALSLSNMPDVIAGSAYMSLFRGLATIQDNKDQSKYLYLRTVMLVTVYALPFSVGLWWLAAPFISVAYGPAWLAAVEPLKILAVSMLFHCIAAPSGALIAAQNRLGEELRIQLECLVLIAVGCIIGARWGIVGVSWAMLLSFFYHCLRMVSIANRCIDGKYSEIWSALQPSVILNGILILALLLADSLLPNNFAVAYPLYYLLLMAGIGGLSYSAAFLYMPVKGLESEVCRWKDRLGLTARRIVPQE